MSTTKKSGRKAKSRKVSFALPAAAAAVNSKLLGRLLVNIGRFLTEVGEAVGGDRLLGTRPADPEPGDKFEFNKKTYVVCGKGACKEVHRENQVWCLPTGKDGCKTPCKCMLLVAKKKDKEPQWEIDPDKPDDSGKYPYDPENYFYFCACMREA